VTVPVLDPTAVNVVVPQPVWVVASEEATPNIGRTTMMMSLGARGTLIAKEKVIAEGADTTWLATVRRLWTIAGDGSTTALEYMIDEEAMLLASARTTAIVREAKFALCANAHVVTPVFILTSHLVLATRVDVAEVSVTAEVDVPEFDGTTVNTVSPHCTYCDNDELSNVKSGRTSTKVSPTFRGAVIENENEIDDIVEAVGLTIVKLLEVSTAKSTAVDDAIATAAILLNGGDMVTVTVRVFKFAACGTELVTTPAAIITVHCTKAGIVEDAAIKVRVDVAVPEFEPDAVKVVVPQPFKVGVSEETNENVGNKSTT